MGSVFMMYGRKCYTTILPRVTTWPVVFVYQLQNIKDTLPNICFISLFVHHIEDDKMSYDPKFPVKMESLSLTIIFGVPCSFWTVSIKELATVLSLKGWNSAHKCAYLVCLSTTTMMALFHSDFCKPMIKSIKASIHHWLGMEIGCRIREVLIV